VAVETFTLLQKIAISYKCCSFELCIHHQKSWKKKCITVIVSKILSTAVFNVDNYKTFWRLE